MEVIFFYYFLIFFSFCFSTIRLIPCSSRCPITRSAPHLFVVGLRVCLILYDAFVGDQREREHFHAAVSCHDNLEYMLIS